MSVKLYVQLRGSKVMNEEDSLSVIHTKSLSTNLYTSTDMNSRQKTCHLII